MSSRPWLVKSIIVVLALLPMFMFLQAVFYFGHAPWEFNAIWAKFTKLNVALILLSPILAVGVYFVQRWAWFGVHVWAVLVIANNIRVFYGPPIHHAIALWGSVLVVISTSMMLWTEKYVSIFFNSRLQWWKIKKRYNLNFRVTLQNKHQEIILETWDISESGAFLNSSNQVEIDGDYLMGIKLNNLATVRGRCKVVRRGVGRDGRNGVGIKFLDFDGPSKKVLTSHLRRTVPA